jgi:hypothetical protein
MARRMKLVAFTSINAAYLAKARVLASTLKRFHPEVEFHLVLAEGRVPLPVLVSDPFDRVVDLRDLGLESDRAWLFKHSVVEMCTALKAVYLKKLLAEREVEAVLYFDPDIAVLGPLTPVFEGLERGSVVLTPHQLEPEEKFEAIIDNEVCALQHGVFNLGFLGVRNDPTGIALANWWDARLSSFCQIDYSRGLFTDQRWFDLVPALFEGVVVLRHPGLDVATWNLSRRQLEGTSPFAVRVDGEPLSFFHFSGFDSGAQLVMAIKYGRDMPVVFALRNWYIRTCRESGQGRSGEQRWAYDFFDNGARITTLHRQVYRNEPCLQRLFPDPFAVANGRQSYCDWYARWSEDAKEGNAPAGALTPARARRDPR